MLDTKFPRYVGDIGNPRSFDFAVTYSIVPGATPEAIVLGDPRIWVDAFIDAGRKLVSQGCAGLATTCGFLTLVREEVEAACKVPVVSSSLEQVRAVGESLLPDQRPGILTISEASLSRAHLDAAKVPYETPVQGLDSGHFATSILSNQTQLDADLSRAELVTAARTLCHKHPDVAAIVLECTNMPPYAEDIARATGRPVHSVITQLTGFHASLVG